MSSAKATRAGLLSALDEALRMVSGQSVLYSQAVAARLGVGSTDLECIDHIVTKGPLTAGDLARATGLTTGAITGVIDRLERAGFARRELDKTDRRKVRVRATPAVATRAAPLFEPMQRAAMSALASYGDGELAVLLDALTRMHAASLVATAELTALPPEAPARGRRRPG